MVTGHRFTVRFLVTLPIITDLFNSFFSQHAKYREAFDKSYSKHQKARTTQLAAVQQEIRSLVQILFERIFRELIFESEIGKILKFSPMHVEFTLRREQSH